MRNRKPSSASMRDVRQPNSMIEGLEGRMLFAAAPAAVHAHAAARLADAQGVVATVVDDSGRTYALSGDGYQMIVTRYTTAGTLDTSWTEDGSYAVHTYSGATVQEIPQAMAIDTRWNLIYVAGSTDGYATVARINIDTVPYLSAWHARYWSGTVNAVSVDPADQRILHVAGTDAGGRVVNAQVHSVDNTDSHGLHHNGGDYITDFGGAGFVVLPSLRSTFSPPHHRHDVPQE